MSMPATHRIIAVLKLPRQVALLLAVAKAIVQALTGSKVFLSPDPTVAALNAAIAELETAEAAVQSRTKGAVSTRNLKKAALFALLEQERGYVQKIADAADRDQASELIASAQMNVRKVPVHGKRTFSAKPGAVSGSAMLATASAGRRASYDWQYSADGGKTWQMALPTLQSKTTLSGLQPGVSYAFRYRAVTKSGAADWSEPTTLLVK
jgi:hypothetical protein